MTVLVSVINYLNDTSKPWNTRSSCCPKVSKLKRRQGKQIQGPTGFRHGTSLPDGTTLLADYLLLILADFQENVDRCDWWKWGGELFGDKRSFDSSHGLRGYSIDFYLPIDWRGPVVVCRGRINIIYGRIKLRCSIHERYREYLRGYASQRK